MLAQFSREFIEWAREAMREWPRVKDAVNRVLNLRGDNVTNTPAGITIGPARGRPSFSYDRPDGFWAIVVSAAADGPNRWRYQVAPAQKMTPGYGAGTWQVIPSSLQAQAFNTVEYTNAASGLLGNGVTVANMGQCSLKPVPNQQIVFVRSLTVGTDVERWFSYENGVDRN